MQLPHAHIEAQDTRPPTQRPHKTIRKGPARPAGGTVPEVAASLRVMLQQYVP